MAAQQASAEEPLVIEHEGQPTHVLLSWSAWQRLQRELEDQSDILAAAEALAAWRAEGSPSLSLDEVLAENGWTRDGLRK